MFTRRYQRCSCMNNQAWNTSTNMIEDKCNNDCSTNCSYEQQEPVDCCECGFDEEYEMSVFPDNPMLALKLELINCSSGVMKLFFLVLQN